MSGPPRALGLIPRIEALEAELARMKAELGAVPVDLSQRLALAVPEAARALGISERHLRAILPSLPHAHLGGRVVLPTDSLRDYLRRAVQLEAERGEGIVETALARVGMK